MIKKISRLSFINKFVIFFAFALLGSMFGHIPKAHAYPNCNTTNTAWVNVIVGVEIENSDGSFNSFSTNFNFNVTASVPRFEYGVTPQTRNPAISYLTQAILGNNGGALGSTPSYDSTTQRYASTATVDANQSGAGSYTHSCSITYYNNGTSGGTTTASQPVYDFVGPSGGSPPSGNSNDYLNCLAPVDAGNGNNSATFRFDTPVLNNSALSGGTWSVSNVTYFPTPGSSLNGSPQYQVLFVYVLPPQPVNIQGTIMQKTTGGTYTALSGVTVEVDDLTTNTHQDFTTSGSATYVITDPVRITDVFAVQIIGYPSGYSAPSTDYEGSTNYAATYPCNTTGIYRQMQAAINTSSYYTPSGVCSGSPPTVANNEFNFLFIQPSSPSPTYQPYFNVVGGNVESGISYTPCNPNTNAYISGTSVTNSGKYYGAFGQEAALAPSTISGFTTAENPNNSVGYSTSPTVGPPNGLTLSGLDSGAAVFPECVYDYYANTNRTVATGTSSSPASLASGTYLYNGSGPLTIGSPSTTTTIAAGKQIIYIVNNGQNVYIDGKINYGSYSAVNNIPLFELIVYGSNIYIDPSVASIEGVYVDEANSGTGGTIVTCGNLSGSIFSYSTCNSQLTVYGSVSSTKVELLRTIGDANSTSSQPAEDFVTSPEDWLPEASIPYTNAPESAQSVQQLPPYL